MHQLFAFSTIFAKLFNVVDLFACFKDWNTIKRVVLGLGWMTLWIFIWGLIPILGLLFALAMILMNIAVIALAPLFVGLVQAAFYEEITATAVCYCSGCGFKLTSEVPACPNCGKPIQ